MLGKRGALVENQYDHELLITLRNVSTYAAKGMKRVGLSLLMKHHSNFTSLRMHQRVRVPQNLSRISRAQMKANRPEGTKSYLAKARYQLQQGKLNVSMTPIPRAGI